VVANWYLGAAQLARGECRESVRHCEAAIALIPEDLRQERFGQTSIIATSARWTLAGALGVLGRFSEAFEYLREAMQIAEEAGHVWTLLFPLFGLGTLKLDQGDLAAAVAPLERGLDLCRTREAPLLLHDFARALGAAYHCNGRRAEGIALLEDAARGVAERSRRWIGWAGYAGALAEVYFRDGQLADATRLAQDELRAARQRGEREVQGRLLRLLGDIAAHPERLEIDAAKAHYREAQDLAEELGMRPLLARCHLGFGTLSGRVGTREEARVHLTTARAMFAEMEMRYWREQAEMAQTGLP
jgi:tetratricopeptide (TPR) repeat protein